MPPRTQEWIERRVLRMRRDGFRIVYIAREVGIHRNQVTSIIQRGGRRQAAVQEEPPAMVPGLAADVRAAIRELLNEGRSIDVIEAVFGDVWDRFNGGE